MPQRQGPDDGAADGKEVSIFVDEKIFASSVHSELSCAECHEDLTKEHPDDEKPAKPVNCASCHEERVGHL